MATITEDYVSFETAKLLKEKGFNSKCNKCYAYFADDEIRVLNLKYSKLAQLLIEDRYPCVTLQMAMKYLREVHGLFISIGNDDLDYNWQIFDIKNRTKDLDPICLTDSYGGYKKYETTCDAAIKHCLEKII